METDRLRTSYVASYSTASRWMETGFSTKLCRISRLEERSCRAEDGRIYQGYCGPEARKTLDVNDRRNRNPCSPNHLETGRGLEAGGWIRNEVGSSGRGIFFCRNRVKLDRPMPAASPPTRSTTRLRIFDPWASRRRGRRGRGWSGRETGGLYGGDISSSASSEGRIVLGVQPRESRGFPERPLTRTRLQRAKRGW